jgi:AraC-like DNA-binding protein
MRTLLGDHRSELLNSRDEQATLGFEAHLQVGHIGDIGVVAIEGAGRTRLDRHQAPGHAVLWLPLSGWVRETVNGEEVLAEPGMAMLCRPGLHLLGESSARLRGVSLLVPSERLVAMGFSPAPMASSPPPVLIGSGPQARAVIDQALRLVALLGRSGSRGAWSAEEETEHLLEALLTWEAAQSPSLHDQPPPSRSAAVVAEAEAWMQAHLHQPLRVPDLARQLSLTPRSLQLAFQRELGCTPMQRLKRLRLQALHRLLERPELGAQPLQHLLAGVGLPGYGRTRAEFRDWCGSSPQELRHRALTSQPPDRLSRAPRSAAPASPASTPPPAQTDSCRSDRARRRDRG